LNFIIDLEKNDYITINAIEIYKPNIIFQVNKGYGDAILLGMKNVKTKYFSIFNADGSFDPYELEGMYNQIKNNSLDLLLASRYKKNASSEDDTVITLIGNKIFTLLGKIFFSLPISDILYTYVMGDTQKILSLNLQQRDFTLCVELPIKAKRNGLNIADIPANEKSRIGGTKKVNAFKDGFLILIHMIKLFLKK
jgi:glycosyltransferase involved in cell wall biosynthesis